MKILAQNEIKQLFDNRFFHKNNVSSPPPNLLNYLATLQLTCSNKDFWDLVKPNAYQLHYLNESLVQCYQSFETTADLESLQQFLVAHTYPDNIRKVQCELLKKVLGKEKNYSVKKMDGILLEHIDTSINVLNKYMPSETKDILYNIVSKKMSANSSTQEAAKEILKEINSIEKSNTLPLLLNSNVETLYAASLQINYYHLFQQVELDPVILMNNLLLLDEYFKCSHALDASEEFFTVTLTTSDKTKADSFKEVFLQAVQFLFIAKHMILDYLYVTDKDHSDTIADFHTKFQSYLLSLTLQQELTTNNDHHKKIKI